MKPFKTFIRALVFFWALLAILLLFPVGVFLFRPEWIPYDRVLNQAIAPLLKGQGLNWKKTHLQLTSLSLTRKEIELNLVQPCFFSASDAPQKKWIEACFQSARLGFTVNLSLRAFEKARILERISLLELLGGNLQISLRGPSASAPPSSSARPSRFLQGLSQTPLQSARIEVKRWKILSDDPRFWPSSRGDFSVRTREAQIQWEFSAVLPHRTSVHLQGTLAQNLAQPTAPRLRGTIRGKGTRLQPWSHLLLGEAIPIDRLNLNACRFELEPSQGIHFSCGLDVGLHYPRPNPQNKNTALLYRVLEIENLRLLRADLKTDWTWKNQTTRGQGHLTVQSLGAGPALLWGKVDADFLPDGSTPLRFEAQARFPDFQKLRTSLKNSDWAVPAPFNILSGQIAIEAKGHTDTRTFSSMALQLTTNLASPHSSSSASESRMKLESRGTLDFKMKGKDFLSDLKLRTILSDVQLPLPSLAFAAPPALLPDSRFISFSQENFEKKPQAGGPPSLFHYQLSFSSPIHHPVFLLSNLTQAKVPLSMALELSNENLTGTLQSNGFPLELFRRNARVENLLIGFKSASGGPAEHPLRSTVRVQYVDYTVTIQLTGTLEKPNMNLSSVPPLAQDRLIAVLLFGQPLDELAPDEAISVGEAKAALTNGAINFISLYLLASTPVQSINYDPRSGIFTAKLRLGEGASLNIGADPNELQSIELQKRIGPNWVITTQVTDPTISEQRSVQAFLEWKRRY